MVMGTASAILKVLLTGEDRSASKAIRGVGDQAHKAGQRASKMGAAAKIGFTALAAGALVAGKAALDFGQDSLVAFQDAEKSQNKLADAYQRFPALADVSIDALRGYNQELQRKTGADADAVASGQATLAAFGLTGEQLKKVTPLLVDYANKTGKDIPTAGKLIGKALLGNTRALKDLGIDYKMTGDKGKDYAAIMALIGEKVGGYTDQLPEAERKSKILKESFGDLQEAIGSKLQPAMIKMMDAGQGVLDWLDANPKVAAGASAALDLLGMTFEGIWFVLSKFVLPVLGLLVGHFGDVVRGAGGMLEALGEFPGMEWAKDASERVNKVADSLNAVGDGLESLADEPDPQIKVRDEATRQVAAIDRKIQSLRGKIVTAKANGDDREVESLRKKIAALKGKRVDVEANVKKTGVSTIRLKDVGAGGLRISAYAKGTRRAAPGPALVGEDGPEIISMRGGESVLSAAESIAAQRIAGTPTLAPVSITNIFHTDVTGVLSEDQAGRKIEQALNKVSLNRGGRGFKA